MSSHLMRNSSRKKFTTSPQDLSASLDQKNSMIAVLQSEVENLRCNEEKLQRLQQCVYRSKQKYQSLIKDYQIASSNNHQRLDYSNKNFTQLRVQCQQFQKQLQSINQQLKDAKTESQQLVQHSNMRQDQILQIQFKGDQLREANDFLLMEGQRIMTQIEQTKQQIQKQRNDAANIHKTIQNIKEKCYKVQSYNRNLIRQEENISQNLSKIQQENNYLDSKITQLTDIQQASLRQCSRVESQIQQGKAYKATKQLELKKVDRENKQLIKNINLEKSKIKTFNEQLEQKKLFLARLENQIRQCSQEINYILGKSQQITAVNGQLRKDQKVCQIHLQNVMRLNKNIEIELNKFKQTNLAVIKKLQQPLNKDNHNSTLNVVDMNRISTSSNNWNKHSRLATTGSGFDTSI